MRKWLWLFILALAPASYAQINIPAPSYVRTLPATCGNSGSWVLISTGAYYVCFNGVPTLVGGSGGSGTVSSGGPYAIPGYGAGTSTTVGPTNITTDATGNNLNVPGTVAAGTVVPAALDNSIYAVGYGVKADGQTVGDASTVVTSSTITCPASDCNFTATDVGKIAFVTSMTQDITMADSGVVVARSTITIVNNAQSITVSPGSANGTYTGQARLVWGHLDSAAYNVTQTTANDSLFAAWTAAQSNCQPLVLPAGYMLVEQPEFYTYSTTTGCAEVNTNLALRKGYEISGSGSQSTFIVPTPAMLGTNCTGPNTAQNGCFFSVPTISLNHLAIFGAGNGTLDSSFNGKAAILVPSISVGTNFFFNDVALLGWGGETANFTGVSIGGTSPNLSNGFMDKVGLEGFGNTQLLVNMAIQAPLTFTNGYNVLCGLSCLTLNAGTMFSNSNSYGFAVSTTRDMFTVDASGMFYSTNDAFPWAAAIGYAQFRNKDQAFFDNLFMQDLNTGTYGIVTDNSFCLLHLANSFIKMGTAANAVVLSSPFIDGGGNNISGYSLLTSAASIAGGPANLSTQSVITAASTITPQTQVFHVGGTTAINTITVPTFCIPDSFIGMVDSTTCQLFLIPDAAFTTTTAGNIAITSLGIVGKQLIMTYDPTAAKWYPSY
jgi:hypothetical protein